MADCLDELKILHRMQWDELLESRHGREFNPDYARLLAGNEAQKYVLFTARKNGELIGNCAIWLYESTHTKELCAKEDTLFIIREHRKGRVGIKFFQYCEAVLVALGVKEIGFSVKTTNKVWRAWERLGYQVTAYQMTKVIKE